MKEKSQEAKLEWDEDLARRMRAEGTSWKNLARTFGVTPETIRCRLDEEYKRIHRERHNKYLRELRRGLAADRIVLHQAERIDKEALAQRLAEIPDDTRDLTAFLMGDPLPGRSALDRRT